MLRTAYSVQTAKKRAIKPRKEKEEEEEGDCHLKPASFAQRNQTRTSLVSIRRCVRVCVKKRVVGRRGGRITYGLALSHKLRALV